MQAAPSTVSDRPAGELATVTATTVAKLAVTDAGALIVTLCGVVLPVSTPEKPETW